MAPHQPLDVSWAEPSREPPPFLANGERRKSDRKKRRGIVYEQRGHVELSARYHPYYVPAPWFVYRERGCAKNFWCRPDGLIIRPREGIITIVEFKYTHTPQAWWQLLCLYVPVVSAYFGTDLWAYRCAEVVKWYDPSTSFPGHHTLRPDVRTAKPGEVAVMIWRPRRVEPLGALA